MNTSERCKMFWPPIIKICLWFRVTTQGLALAVKA